MQIIKDSIDFSKYLQKTQAEEIRNPDYWTDKLAALFEHDGIDSGDLLPWGKTHDRFQLRSGEVTIWAGINGHGKSMITGQVALWLLQQTKVCIASMEMKPEATLQRMVRQASGVNHVSREYQNHFLSWSNGKLWIYDKLDQVPVDSILGMITYCATELGIKHIFIDSLMKVGIDDDNYNGQKRFVDTLCQLAKQFDIHIHLIAHMRKGESENKRPGKFDVMGSSALTNLVDNLLVVHANKSKKANLENEKDPKKIDKLHQDSDFTLSIAKQRHGSYEGAFAFWFHENCQQFLPTNTRQTMQFKIGYRGES